MVDAARPTGHAVVRRLTLGQLVFDGLLALLVLGLGEVSAASGGAIMWAATLPFAAAVVLRRLCPWVMIGLAVLAGLVQVVGANANLIGVLVFALLFATTGNDRDPRIRRAGLAAVAVASVGGGVAGATHGLFGDPQTPGSLGGVLMALQIATVAGGAWLVGFVRHQRRLTAEARVAEQIARVEERRVADLFLQEQERNRIARDMHDVVAHTLAVVVAQAEGARYAMARRPELVERTLRTIATTSREALGDVRGLLTELRGEEPAARGQGDAGQVGLFERMRLAGLDLEVADVGELRPLPPAHEEAAHWVLTEALTNALKHGATGEPVTIRRVWDGGVDMSVANAVRPDTTSPVSGTGHGLVGMAERAGLVGGQVEHGLEHGPDGERFVVRLRLPDALRARRPA